MHRFKFANVLVAFSMIFAVLSVPNQAYAEEGPLSVTGNREVGQVLQLQDTNAWDSAPEIQWLRDFQPIPGANSTSYQLQAKDYLRSVTVRAVGESGGVAKVRFSLPIARTAKGTFDGTRGEQPVGVYSNFWHTCVAQIGGSAQCIGRNRYGEIGNGTIEAAYNPNPKPETVKDLDGVVSLSTSDRSSCAALEDGTVKCWGIQLFSDGIEQAILSPELVEGVEDAIMLGQGGTHNCALLAGGAISCWGANFGGQLGDGTQIERINAIEVENISGVVDVSLTSGTTCVLTYDGSVRCWGYNYNGELGNGTTENASTPSYMTSLFPAIKVAGGGNHMCSLTITRTVKCWGSNYEYQSGFASLQNVLEPRTVEGLYNIKDLIVGGSKSCVIKSDGTLWCWGGGPLGDGSSPQEPGKSEPVQISGTGDIQQIYAGLSGMFVVTTQGATKGWGFGPGVGTGTDEEVLVPSPTVLNRWQTRKSVPVVAGDPRVGSILLANSGLWDSGVSLSYQWLSDGVEIESATDDRYLVSNEVAGTRLSLKVEASKVGFLTHFTESAPTQMVTGGKISAPTSLTVIGAAKFGESLSAAPYFWDPTVTLDYAWQREGSSSVLGRSQNYVVAVADVGKRIRLTLRATKLGHDTVTLITPYSSKITLRSFASPPIPSITGTMKVGKTVTGVTGVWLENPNVSYQWLLDGKPISKATKATLKIPTSAKNRKLSIRVTATKPGYVSVSKTSGVKKVS